MIDPVPAWATITLTVSNNRPLIDGLHQPVEGHLSPDGHEGHNTVPRYNGPSGLANCGHCVNHKSACLPILCPDI